MKVMNTLALSVARVGSGRDLSTWSDFAPEIMGTYAARSAWSDHPVAGNRHLGRLTAPPATADDLLRERCSAHHEHVNVDLEL